MFGNKSCALLLFLRFYIISSMPHAADIKVGLISLPVNGTHLAHKCIELLLKPYGGWEPPKNKMGGQHMVADKTNVSFFRDGNYKLVFMIRDPRDRVVSYAYKVKKSNPKVTISISDLTFDVITKYGTVTYNYLTRIPFYKNMGDFSEYYKMYFSWFEYPDILIVFFENLVGPKAGGSAKKQLAEIEKIANFLGINATEQEIQAVADNLWGGTFSFRDPKIGRWKEVFTEKHKVAFKKTCMAQFLIDFGYEEDTLW